MVELSAAVCCWCQHPLVKLEGAWWCSSKSPKCRNRQAHWGAALYQKKKRVGWRYVPTPKQVEAHEMQQAVKYTLYGGAAGPGKSRQLREALYRDCMTIPNLSCLLLRRTYRQLEDTHLREFMKDATGLGADYLDGKKELRFPNGSLIKAGHCENAKDAENYLSTEYDRIVFDELVTFDEEPALEIMSRARTSNPEVLKRGGARVWAASNPGGRGALWVKDRYIDHDIDTAKFSKYQPEQWVFLDAKLEDNPYMDPEYRSTLENLPEARRRQLLGGDWTVYEGQFFPDWRPSQPDGTPWHVVSLQIALGIEVFASMDWGYNSPGCVLWWACLPDGRLHIVDELKFQGQTAEQVGRQIHQKTKAMGTSLRYIAADPAMWQKTGHGKGEAIAETLSRMKLPMRRSDNDRFNGWMRVHELLRPKTDDEPWLTVDPKCKYLARTLPAMIQSDTDPDDMDTTQDDHACDALRYGAMSRPSPSRFVPQVDVVVGSPKFWRDYHEKASRRQGVNA